MHRWLRALVLWLVRLYYPRRVLIGRERLPTADVPAIFVLNHPNGLVDPVLLEVLIGRRVRFLAKSTLFANAFGRLGTRAFGALPVWRAQDDAATNSPGELPTRAERNEQTFAQARAALLAGEALALFPEGTSHSDPALRPLKTGAARIALGAASDLRAAGRSSGELKLVPVGLQYERKATFRSAVLGVVGEPLEVDEAEDPSALTRRLRAALDDVVVQAESRDVLHGVARVASWTAPAGDEITDASDRLVRMQRLLAAYTRMRQDQPERLAELLADVQAFAQGLRRCGVRDPWALQMRAPTARAVVGLLSAGALLIPWAVGVVTSWIPYRLAGVVAARVCKGEDDILSTVKLLAGALFLTVAWTAEVVAAGVLVGAWAAGAVAFAAPVSGYIALRVADGVPAWKAATRVAVLRLRRGPEAEAILATRARLASRIMNALADYKPAAQREI